MADVVDIDHKRKERKANWWKYHDQMEAKLLAGNEDLQLLKEMTEAATQLLDEKEILLSLLAEVRQDLLVRAEMEKPLNDGEVILSISQGLLVRIDAALKGEAA